jgi:hypothetical protein
MKPKEKWIQEMIERESIPKAERKETVEAFCERNSISIGTYYYQALKEDNQREIIKNSVRLAKTALPEVLKKLEEKAKEGDMKAIEMFLNYVAELSKNLDIKSGGKPLYMPSDIIKKYDTTSETETDS